MKGKFMMFDTKAMIKSSSSTEFVDVLTRADSDTSSLTAEKDVLDNSRAWTDEKHNLYLNQLEGSFVTQLQQSRGIVGRCYELNKRDVNISEKRPVGTRNFSGQFAVLRNARWQNIKSERAKLLSDASAESLCHVKSEFHPPSTNNYKADFLNLSITQKHKKRVICHDLATCSRDCTTNSVYQGNSFGITQEGSGQNFSDGKNQSKLNMLSRAKRLKTPSVNEPNLDQIVPQQPSDNKTKSSQRTLNLESFVYPSLN